MGNEDIGILGFYESLPTMEESFQAVLRLYEGDWSALPEALPLLLTMMIFMAFIFWVMSGASLPSNDDQKIKNDEKPKNGDYLTVYTIGDDGEINYMQVTMINGTEDEPARAQFTSTGGADEVE